MLVDPATLRPLREVARDAAQCTRCELSQARSHPVFGEGDPAADLMLIGEAPSRHDDLQGRLFIGGVGNVLTNALLDAGIDRDGIYLTTVVKCPTPHGREPEPGEAEACSGYLRDEIAHVRPRVIVALGPFVTQLLLGRRVPFDKLLGVRLDVFDGVTLVPSFHPGDALRGHPAAVPTLVRDLRTARAVLEGRLATGAAALADLRARRTGDGMP